MKASDVEKAQDAKPPHVFTLQPGAWASMWDRRPREPVLVGLRRVSVEQRLEANRSALARADKCVPEHRRHRSDPFWREAYEVALVSYVLSFALCHPEDMSRPLWQDQDGDLMLLEREAPKPGECPLVNRRFSDEGLTRCFDELEILARKDGVGRRAARDGEMLRFGTLLADGSLIKLLREAPSQEARAVDAHLRILMAQAIDLVEGGREAPSPVAG